MSNGGGGEEAFLAWELVVRECRLWNVWRTQPGGGVVWFPRIKEFQLQLHQRAEVTRLRCGGPRHRNGNTEPAVEATRRSPKRLGVAQKADGGGLVLRSCGG